MQERGLRQPSLVAILVDPASVPEVWSYRNAEFAKSWGPLLVLMMWAATTLVSRSSVEGEIFESASPAVALPELDCGVLGPFPIAGTGPNNPLILNDTSANSGDAGCDGCNISWDLQVLWDHTGTGKISVNGSSQTHTVTPATVTQVEGLLHLACKGAAGEVPSSGKVHAWDYGNPLNSYVIEYKCGACVDQ